MLHHNHRGDLEPDWAMAQYLSPNNCPTSSHRFHLAKAGRENLALEPVGCAQQLPPARRRVQLCKEVVPATRRMHLLES